MALTADHDVGVSAAFEILADGTGDFVGDPLPQGLPDGDMLARD
jgi:hypothetical protein